MAGVEPLDIRGLAEDLRRGQRRAAAQSQQRRSEPPDQGLELWIEFGDLFTEHPATLDQCTGQAGDQPVDAFQPGGGRGQVFEPLQTPRRRLPGRVELVQVPAQPVDDPGAFGDEVLAVAGQQPNLARRAVEAGGGQVWLAQRGAGDGERVDRFGLAVAAGVGPG